MNEYMYTYMHTVAVMQAEETYENLATSFQSVFGEINNMVKNPVLTIYEQSYNVIFYLYCDYKVCNNNIHTTKSFTNMILFCYLWRCSWDFWD